MLSISFSSVPRSVFRNKLTLAVFTLRAAERFCLLQYYNNNKQCIKVLFLKIEMVINHLFFLKNGVWCLC